MARSLLCSQQSPHQLSLFTFQSSKSTLKCRDFVPLNRQNSLSFNFFSWALWCCIIWLKVTKRKSVTFSFSHKSFRKLCVTSSRGHRPLSGKMYLSSIFLFVSFSLKWLFKRPLIAFIMVVSSNSSTAKPPLSIAGILFLAGLKLFLNTFIYLQVTKTRQDIKDVLLRTRRFQQSHAVS